MPMQWQPINTAPRNTPVLAYFPSNAGVWIEAIEINEDGTWYWSLDGDTSQERQPTHWMPLPPPPSTDSK